MKFIEWVTKNGKINKLTPRQIDLVSWIDSQNNVTVIIHNLTKRNQGFCTRPVIDLWFLWRAECNIIYKD